MNPTARKLERSERPTLVAGTARRARSQPNPSGEDRAWRAERTEELAKPVDHKVAEKILKLLTAARAEPPVPIERLDRIMAFWKNKAAVPPS